MPLYGWVRELIGKYTFIDNITMKNARVFFWYYEDNDKNKKLLFKTLPYRATKYQVERLIKRIKDEIGYDEIKKERDKKVKESLKNQDLIFTRV